MSVGMLLDLSFVVENLTLVIGAVVGVLVLKTLCAGGAALVLREPPLRAMGIGLGLAQVGEFSFVLERSGRAAGRRWCTNRNWHATIPTAGASSTDGVRSWAAHVGHRIQHVAREQRFDRSPTGRLGSKTLADDRLVPEEGVLDPRLLMVA